MSVHFLDPMVHIWNVSMYQSSLKDLIKWGVGAWVFKHFETKQTDFQERG